MHFPRKRKKKGSSTSRILNDCMVPNRIPLPGLCLGLGPASCLAQLNCSSFLSDPGEPPDSAAGCPQPRPTSIPAGAALQLKLLHSAWPESQPHLHSSRAWQRAPAHRMSSGQAWKWLAGCTEPCHQTLGSSWLATHVAALPHPCLLTPSLLMNKAGRSLTQLLDLAEPTIMLVPSSPPAANFAIPWPWPSHNRISSLQQRCALSWTL